VCGKVISLDIVTGAGAQLSLVYQEFLPVGVQVVLRGTLVKIGTGVRTSWRKQMKP
jgi:hypothetical protein